MVDGRDVSGFCEIGEEIMGSIEVGECMAR